MNDQIATATTALASITESINSGGFGAATAATLAQVAVLAGVDPSTLSASVDTSTASVYVPPSRANPTAAPAPSGLSGGYMAAIVIGSVAFVAIVLAVLWVKGVLVIGGGATSATSAVEEWGGAEGTGAPAPAAPAASPEDIPVVLESAPATAPAGSVQVVTLPATRV